MRAHMVRRSYCFIRGIVLVSWFLPLPLSGAMPKAAKRRRVALAGTGVNTRKLQKVLSILKRSDAPMEDLSLTARQINKAVLEFWNEFSTAHEVGTFEWEFASIAGLLSVTVER